MRHPLTHQSGLHGDIFGGWILGQHDHEFDEPLQTHDETAYRSVLPVLADQYFTMPTETMFSYSNVGFSVLGILVERVTGQQYGEYVERTILDPLGMEASGLHPDQFEREHLAMGYPTGRGGPEPYARIRDVPAGSMVASLDDMGRFMQMLLQDGSPTKRERCSGWEVCGRPYLLAQQSDRDSRSEAHESQR